MSYRINNKCNRVKGWRWRWLMYALNNFYCVIICCLFSEATTTVLESFTNSIEKHLCWSLFLKKLQACRPISGLLFSIPDNSCWFRQILSIVWTLLWIFGNWFMKMSRKKHFATNIYIYGSSQTFWSFIRFYFVHMARGFFVFKNQSLCLHSSVYA